MVLIPEKRAVPDEALSGVCSLTSNVLLWPKLVTNSIIFCCLFIFKDRRKTTVFCTNTQSRFASVVLDRIKRPSLLVLEPMHKVRLKGAVSAQKASYWSQTQTRKLLGGAKQNNVLPMRVHKFALQVRGHTLSITAIFWQSPLGCGL